MAWKSGHRKEDRALRAVGRLGGGIPEAELSPCVDEGEAHQVRADVAVRADRTLGASRGARGVEDGGVILRINGDVRGRGVCIDIAERQGKGPFGHRCRSVRRGADTQGRTGARGTVLVGDDQGRQAPQSPEKGPNRLGPLRIDEGDLRTGILQPVAQLLTRPPGVQRDHDGPGQGDGPEGHDPFGQIAHGDGDPIARSDREFVPQPVGQGAGDPVVLREAGALVLVDQERAVPMAERKVEHGAECLRCVLPRAGGNAADIPVLHFEQLTRRGEGCVGFGHRDGRRPVLARRACLGGCVRAGGHEAGAGGEGGVSGAGLKTAPR